MIRVEEVRTRIEAEVPELAARMRPATEFAHMVERNQLPQTTPAGFVLMGGLEGGAVQAGAGAFIQDFAETVSVVLVVRVASDPTGAAALDEASPLVRKVVFALVGWGPDDAPGIFALVRAETVGATQGALVFQIDLALQDQMRIIS